MRMIKRYVVLDLFWDKRLEIFLVLKDRKEGIIGTAPQKEFFLSGAYAAVIPAYNESEVPLEEMEEALSEMREDEGSN